MVTSRVRLDSGGYDPIGYYYGIPNNLYEAYADGVEPFRFRAADRAAAKAYVNNLFPNARYFR
jgi:hypothetical protein